MSKLKDKMYNYFVRTNGRVWYEYERYVREHMEEYHTHRFARLKVLVKLNWFYRVKKKNTPYLYWDVPVNPTMEEKPVKKDIKKNSIAKENEISAELADSENNGNGQESASVKRKDIKVLSEKLMKYDVISFDMFDTLILRSVEKPVDVFSFIGNEIDIPNFKKIRREIESELREKSINEETTIDEIYTLISERYGIDKIKGIEIEFKYELAICVPNPYMQELYNELIKRHKKIIVTSNMYWDESRLKKILDNCGYKEIENIFVSCEYGQSKKYGKLQNLVVDKLGHNKKYVHIGDNYFGDVEGSRCADWAGVYYESVRDLGTKYRPDNMTSLSSSIYKGLVNNKLFSAGNLNPYYEYGYAYVGYMVLGFCRWLDNLAKEKNIDMFWFVSRDMQVVYNVYQKYFGNIESEYIKASRTSSIHLSFNRHIDHFMDWHVKRRISSNNTIEEVLYELGFDYLIDKIGRVELEKNEILTADNIPKIRELLYQNKTLILEKYDNERQAAERYYREKIKNKKNICIVDLGWKASTYSSLKTFLCDECGMDLNMYSAMIGMEGHPFVEDLMSNNEVFTYVFSKWKNKDLMDIHNENGNIWRRIYEIIFTSNEKSLLGFELVDDKVQLKYMRKEMRNDNIVSNIHRGIMEFADDYIKVERKLGFSMSISGRESYLPLMNIMKNEKYNYELFSEFEVCFIAGNVQNSNIELFSDVVEKGGK